MGNIISCCHRVITYIQAKVVGKFKVNCWLDSSTVVPLERIPKGHASYCSSNFPVVWQYATGLIMQRNCNWEWRQYRSVCYIPALVIKASRKIVSRSHRKLSGTMTYSF